MALFCENAKAEILAAAIHSHKAKQAFLSAVFRCAASVEFVGGQRAFVLKLDNAELKAAVCKLLNSLYKNGIYTDGRARIRIAGDYFVRLALDLKIFKKEEGTDALAYESGIHPDLVLDAESRTAYLRGLFIGAGSVTILKGYHLEFGFTNGFLAADCGRLLGNWGFRVASLKHKDKEVLYFKGSEAVSDLLAYLGAAKSVLELNDVFARRATDKLTNCRINCDMANIDKTVAAAQQQIETIRALEQSGKLKSLPQKLQDAAAMRLRFPEASLSALAEMLKISKSGLRHRLDKLVLCAREEME